MKRLKLCWLLLALGLVAACVLTGEGLLCALLLTLVVLPVLCALCSLAAADRLKVSLSLPVNMGKNQRETVVLTLQNPTILPVFRLTCRVTVENCLNGDRQTLQVHSFLLPRQTQQVQLVLESSWCGRLQLRAEHFHLYDCFGLLPIPAKLTAAAALTIQPDTFEQTIAVSADANCPDDSEVYSQEKPGYDLTETFQIREYQVGDSIRQVHWKLTSKLDRLIIRDPSLPVTRSVMIFWERAGESDVQSTDAQAEVVITACRALVSQSVQFTVAWNDVEQDVCVLQEVRDMEDLIGLMPRLLAARGKADAPCGAGLLVQSSGEATFSHILYVAGQLLEESAGLGQLGRVTPLICGRDFTADNYAQRLMDLEI